MKKCSRCKLLLPHASFNRDRSSSTGYSSYCRECISKYNKTKYPRKNPPIKKAGTLKECRTCHQMVPTKDFPSNRNTCSACVSKSGRDRTIKSKYGLMPEDYDKLMDRGNGVCYICQGVNPNGKALSVDHDHKCCSGQMTCGKCIRGLLCQRCNIGISLFNDDVNLLASATSYLT